MEESDDGWVTCNSESRDSVDLAQIIKLLDQHRAHSIQCQEKDAVFLLGNTGAGKSCTINYLAGRKVVVMREPVLDENLVVKDYVERIDVENPLDGCKVGHRGDSQTRYLRCFESPDCSLVYCDTPGFDDTEGSAVDIANAIAIASALRGCKSVRLVLVIEANTILMSRGKELKNLLLLLCRFIRKIDNHLDSAFPYCFNLLRRIAKTNVFLLGFGRFFLSSRIARTRPQENFNQLWKATSAQAHSLPTSAPFSPACSAC